MKTSDIRQRFLDHFEQLGHTVVPSASLILDDPNLLFVNAGMVPFKPYFLGQMTPPYARAASVQKCVRTLDIDEVGRTTRHGTFFQMNGNFSFGDYFKKGAIEYAWDLITKPVSSGGYGLDESLLWVTVYHDDDEAAEIWRRHIGVPEARIVRRGMEDNYWSMGVPGPCGPCSEIYIDRGPLYGREGGPEVDEDRYLEFWNLVFMQYERGEGPAKKDYPLLGELPNKNIDTGMGLERMSALLQGVDNLYEIDQMRPIIDRASELTGKIYGVSSGHSAAESHPDDVRLRVIADHTRTGLMMIADGVTPSNEGRGYVLRRILRRVVRAMRLLGYPEAAFPHLLPIARDVMKSSYPDVETDWERISTYAYAEEEAFDQTLRQGTTLLDTSVAEVRTNGESRLSGAKAFQLHDTYGFPIDLTIEMAAEQGISVDEEGFRQLMAEQKARAKADAVARKTGHGDVSAFRAVLDTHGPTTWLAYEALETEGKVLALLDADGESLSVAKSGQIVTAVLDQTTFYAESGGQSADAGLLITSGARAEVLDVQRPLKGLVAHKIRILEGEIGLDESVHAAVDPEWRLGARQAHSGTHVIHAALREVLGNSALQSGSFNRPGYLRLDFSWRSALSRETRSEIEEAGNKAIRQDFPVSVHYMSLPEAKTFGALALFGETYDETVRVVEIGGPWSRELCGGTHVSRAAQIGMVAVTSESSVGAGQRRVEAVTGLEAFQYLARERDLVSQLSEELKAPRGELVERVGDILARLKAAERDAAALRAAQSRASAAALAQEAEVLAGIGFVATEAPAGSSGNDVRTLALDIRGNLDEKQPGVVAVGSRVDNKGNLVVVVNEAARNAGFMASELLKGVLSGRGGGSPEVAQGGMPADDLPTVLAALREQVARHT